MSIEVEICRRITVDFEGENSDIGFVHVRLGINDIVGEFMEGNTPHTGFCRGEAFVSGFMNQSRIYLHECFALAARMKGEAFGYKNLGRVAKLIARMLRPYIIICLRRGLTPAQFANGIIDSLAGEWAIPDVS